MNVVKRKMGTLKSARDPLEKFVLNIRKPNMSSIGKAGAAGTKRGPARRV